MKLGHGASWSFLAGEGPSRGLLRDCEIVTNALQWFVCSSFSIKSKLNVFLSPLQDLAAVRGAVRAGPAVRVLVVAHPRARCQPVRLLAEVRLSPHHPRQQRHLRRILLHLIDRVSNVEIYRRLPL